MVYFHSRCAWAVIYMYYRMHCQSAITTRVSLPVLVTSLLSCQVKLQWLQKEIDDVIEQEERLRRKLQLQSEKMQVAPGACISDKRSH